MSQYNFIIIFPFSYLSMFILFSMPPLSIFLFSLLYPEAFIFSYLFAFPLFVPYHFSFSSLKRKRKPIQLHLAVT